VKSQKIMAVNGRIKTRLKLNQVCDDIEPKDRSYEGEMRREALELYDFN
jgi:hypothetical protein